MSEVNQELNELEKKSKEIFEIIYDENKKFNKFKSFFLKNKYRLKARNTGNYALYVKNSLQNYDFSGIIQNFYAICIKWTKSTIKAFLLTNNRKVIARKSKEN